MNPESKYLEQDELVRMCTSQVLSLLFRLEAEVHPLSFSVLELKRCGRQILFGINRAIVALRG